MTFSVLQMTFSSISALNSALELGYPPHKPQKPSKPRKRPPIGSKKGVFWLWMAILRKKRRIWGFQKGYIYSYTLRYLGFSFRISTVSGPFRAKSRFQVFDPFFRVYDFLEKRANYTFLHTKFSLFCQKSIKLGPFWKKWPFFDIKKTRPGV